MVEHVDRWLESLGLGKYATLFAESEITADVLPDLTETDLEKLGLPLGARKKIIKAASALATAADRDQPPGLAEAPAVVVPIVPTQAERRQLTVMFVDLVGSTALSGRLDPEEMADLLRAYQNAVAGEIARFDGHVAKFMGDGVLAYFGWPRAHEDEAERAVRAGLSVRDAVGRLHSGDAALACRIGIATGLVVVGELIGQGSASEETVVGDTPNLAARLQALAEPGQVMVGDVTRRLLGAGIAFDDLGEQRLKGIDQPVTAYSVTGERTMPSRFEQRAGAALLPMVGRAQELALLLERWSQAKAGEGQGVLLVGEAGIGKSRITRALLDAVRAEPHVSVRLQCSPYHADSAFWPMIQQLAHAAGFADNDSNAQQLDKLEAMLSPAGNATAAPLLADLLGLDGTGRYGAIDLTPQERRARTLDGLTSQLFGLARHQPVLLILEDAHWIDPTTLELIKQVLDQMGDTRLMLLVTSRPDEQPTLVGHPHVTRLTLNRLGRTSVEAIVKRLGGDELPPAIVDEIIARTDSVPLYVEELTKAVLETGDAAIPPSLHDSLMARLDRIPEVKGVAQIAACIGRDFTYRLLAAVADLPDAELTNALEKLADAELVFRRGSPLGESYIFKHALVRDAAYESLLRSRRIDIHAQLAAILEGEAKSGVSAAPEMLAQHHAAGGNPRRAVDYWKMAGDQARARYANREATVSYAKGLELLAGLQQSEDRDKAELDLRLAASRPILVGEGYTSAALEQNASRIADLARAVGDDFTLWRALYDLGRFGNQRANSPGTQGVNAETIGLEIIEIGERMGDKCAVAAGLYTLVGHKLLRADFSSTMELCTRCAALGLSAQEQLDVADNFQAAIGCGLANAQLHWHLGHIWQARSMADSAAQQAREMDRPFTLAFAFQRTAILRQLERLSGPAQQATSQFLAVHERFPAPHWLPWVMIIRAWSHMAEDRMDAALSDLKRAWPLWHERGGSEFLGPFFRCISAEVLLAASQHDWAATLLDEALALQESTMQRHWDAELHRTKAALLLAREQASSQVEHELRAALSISRSQSAKSLELRAARDLARLWAERGERQRALDLLAPVYAWFTEGFDTPDLVEARELLDRLG